MIADAMLERARRPLEASDRLIIDQFRRAQIGRVRFEARYAALGGIVAFVLGVVWILGWHWDDPNASFAALALIAAAGVALGVPFEARRTRRTRKKREAAAAARWDPVVAAGTVERTVAVATEGLRCDDREGNTAWFLQVAQDQILCVWDWAEHPTNRLEMDLIPGEPPTPLKITWTGESLSLVGARRFHAGERKPESGEVFMGTVRDLVRVLSEGSPEGPK